MSSKTTLAALIAALTFGCGGAQNPRDEDLTAEEHEAEAEREEAAAEQHEAQTRGTVFYAQDVYDPSDAHRFEAEQHREHAEAHRRMAERLRAFEDAECSEFPPETRASCPLLLDLESIEDIEGGVRLTFAADQEIEPVIDHIRCHIAFAQAEGTGGIDSCALYVPGTTVTVNMNVVDLVTDEEEHVAELRRRVSVQAPPDDEE